MSASELNLRRRQMYATDRRQTDKTDVRRQTASSLNAPPLGGGIITLCYTPTHASNRCRLKSFTSCAFVVDSLLQNEMY